MAVLPYKACGFPASTLAGPASGKLTLSLAKLIHAAMTVGMTPINMGGRQRPLTELCWRAFMAGASVERTSAGWIKTAGFRYLDRSEKAAVSYFLGMIQAKITCERLLRTQPLVHLDAYLTMTGQPPTRASRPDFVGVSGDRAIVIEAKSRFGRRNRKVIEDAKKQACSLPNILAATETIRVASVASFEAGGRWEAYLEDPPGQSIPGDLIPSQALLAAYYRPVVASVVAAGGRETNQADMMITARLADIDVVLGVPTAIARIMRTLPPVGQVSVDQLYGAGQELLGAVASGASRTDDDLLEGADSEAQPRRQVSYVGLDGVQVELGPTWQ